MFCPNCGRDCADFKFCPECGTQLSVHEVQKSKNTNKGSTEIPTSSGYLGIGSSLVLSDSAVSICVNSLFKKHRTWIPYDQLTTVIYVRPTLKPMTNGALLFRGESNKNVPIPKNGRFQGDQSTVIVSLETDTLFYHIYHMLKAVAPATAKFEMVVPQTKLKGMEEMAQKVDMDYFYTMYAPHRERAASGIQAKYNLSPEIARALVAQVFDDRQQQLYAADPMDALRDLNLVVDDRKRKQQRENRQDAERRKRQKEEAVANSLERLERMKRIEMLDDYLEKHGR